MSTETSTEKLSRLKLELAKADTELNAASVERALRGRSTPSPREILARAKKNICQKIYDHELQQSKSVAEVIEQDLEC